MITQSDSLSINTRYRSEYRTWNMRFPGEKCISFWFALLHDLFFQILGECVTRDETVFYHFFFTLSEGLIKNKTSCPFLLWSSVLFVFSVSGCLILFFASLFQFKEISFAYEVLTNPEKKELYDRYGEQGLREGGGGGPGMDDIFSHIFGGGLFGFMGGQGRGRNGGKRRGDDMVHPLK